MTNETSSNFSDPLDLTDHTLLVRLTRERLAALGSPNDSDDDGHPGFKLAYLLSVYEQARADLIVALF